MDDIPAIHPTSTLLLSKKEEKTKMFNIDTIIPYYSYKTIDNLFYIKIDGDTIVSENKGYWKDKPILEYNNNKYVLLEASSNIVRIDNLGITPESVTPHVMDTKRKEEQISNNLLKSIRDIITTSKPLVKQKEKPIVKKQKFVKNVSTPSELEIKAVLDTNPVSNLTAMKDVMEPLDSNLPQEFEQELKPEIPSPEKIVKSVDEILPKETNGNHSVISAYVNTLKRSDQQTKKEPKSDTNTINYIDNSKPKTIEEELFTLLDIKKDDPRIKRLFSHYTEQTKKEVHEINEKYSKQYLAKFLENSGGGTNAVQYANGGTMDGDLTITSNLSVFGTVYGNIDNKRVFNIGNSVDTDYVLNHDFNTKDLVVSVYDENDEIVLTSIKNINLNQTLITFTSPVLNIKVVIIR